MRLSWRYNMNPEYFSHIPLLAAAVLKTTGPVLELGSGLGSTLLLHGLCGSLNRSLTTLDSNKEWFNLFVHLKRSWHIFRNVADFLDLPEYQKDWGLVFVDHGVMEQRGESIRALQQVPVIIAHDTCHSHLYNYEPILSEFKYRWDWILNPPYTTVVSNTLDVSKMFAGIGL